MTVAMLYNRHYDYIDTELPPLSEVLKGKPYLQVLLKRKIRQRKANIGLSIDIPPNRAIISLLDLIHL